MVRSDLKPLSWSRLLRSTWLVPLVVAATLVFGAPAAAVRGVTAPGVVATENPQATRAALEVLKRGGNAIDAAITAALVAGVVSPVSSGLGGGGFALVHRAGDASPTILDFRETAPAGIDAAAFDRRPLPWEERGKLVGVPGEARGLWELSRRFGKLRWAELVQQAERRARLGFVVSPHLARALATNAQDLQKEPALAALFYGKGQAALAGARLTNPKLARTLARLAAEGPSAIYDGAIAQEIVSTAASAGGALTLTDLANYQVKERLPLKLTWDGYDIFTMPPPSAGGILLAQTLGTFTPDELKALGYQTGALQHLLAESFRRSLIDRVQSIADPDQVLAGQSERSAAAAQETIARLLEPARLAARRRLLSLDRTHSLPLLASEEHGTHHLVVADAAGSVVSLTTTVNRTFGAKLVLPQAGIALNDQLDDFTAQSDAAALGAPNNPNRARPLARPVSSMTPTLVLQAGRPVLALGGSGGMAIATNVTQLLILRLLFGATPDKLLHTPRFYIFPRGPSTVLLEAGASQALLDDLAYRGERVGILPPVAASGVQMIAWDGPMPSCAADPRKFGSAEATGANTGNIGTAAK